MTVAVHSLVSPLEVGITLCKLVDLSFRERLGIRDSGRSTETLVSRCKIHIPDTISRAGPRGFLLPSWHDEPASSQATKIRLAASL
jgi:hypothetical protein